MRITKSIALALLLGVAVLLAPVSAVRMFSFETAAEENPNDALVKAKMVEIDELLADRSCNGDVKDRVHRLQLWMLDKDIKTRTRIKIHHQVKHLSEVCFWSELSRDPKITRQGVKQHQQLAHGTSEELSLDLDMHPSVVNCMVEANKKIEDLKKSTCKPGATKKVAEACERMFNWYTSQCDRPSA